MIVTPYLAKPVDGTQLRTPGFVPPSEREMFLRRHGRKRRRSRPQLAQLRRFLRPAWIFVMVIRRALLPLAVLALTACVERHREPIPLSNGGQAVRNNIRAQIINPIPPGDVVTPVDAARTGLAVEAYRKGEIKDPKEESEKSTTTDVE